MSKIHLLTIANPFSLALAVACLVVSHSAQARGFKPKDLEANCQGTYAVHSVHGVEVYQHSISTRSPVPQYVTKTKANLTLVPVFVSSGCSILGSKYGHIVAQGVAMPASISLSGAKSDEVYALQGSTHAFSVDHEFYELNAKGELSLFPQFAILERLNFVTDIENLESPISHFVDSGKAYGIKPFEQMSYGELHDKMLGLVQEIQALGLNPIDDAPHFKALLWLKPRFNGSDELKSPAYRSALKTYTLTLLNLFQEVTKDMTELPKNTVLTVMASTLNHLVSYEYGQWGDGIDQEFKMQIIYQAPLLYSHEILIKGYQYNAHLNMAEVEQLLLNAAKIIKQTNDEVVKQKYLHGIQSIWSEYKSAQGKHTPQYPLSDFAKEIIAKATS